MRDMKNEMMLSEFIKSLRISTHPNVVALLPLLKENLEERGDVRINVELMIQLMEANDGKRR
jgi:hypothetical protein